MGTTCSSLLFRKFHSGLMNCLVLSLRWHGSAHVGRWLSFIFHNRLWRSCVHNVLFHPRLSLLLSKCIRLIFEFLSRSLDAMSSTSLKCCNSVMSSSDASIDKFRVLPYVPFFLAFPLFFYDAMRTHYGDLLLNYGTCMAVSIPLKMVNLFRTLDGCPLVIASLIFCMFSAPFDFAFSIILMSSSADSLFSSFFVF